MGVKVYVGCFVQKKLLNRQEPENSKRLELSQRITFLDRLLVSTKNPITLNHEAITIVLSSESVSGPLHRTM
jgi:hypothetical protein